MVIFPPIAMLVYQRVIVVKYIYVPRNLPRKKTIHFSQVDSKFSKDHQSIP